jgi:hypothetical protein
MNITVDGRMSMKLVIDGSEEALRAKYERRTLAHNGAVASKAGLTDEQCVMLRIMLAFPNANEIRANTNLRGGQLQAYMRRAPDRYIDYGETAPIGANTRNAGDGRLVVATVDSLTNVTLMDEHPDVAYYAQRVVTKDKTNVFLTLLQEQRLMLCPILSGATSVSITHDINGIAWDASLMKSESNGMVFVSDSSAGTVTLVHVARGIPWITTKGGCSLKAKEATYTFDKNTLAINTRLNGVEKHATVVSTMCDAPAARLLPPEKVTSLQKIGIALVNSSIADEMQTRTDGRHRVFVLPSQLNGAEYQDYKAREPFNTDPIVTQLSGYLSDNTGGPAGQLAGDPGIAQFIIDNASNTNRPTDGINNVRLMGEINGLSVVNGYLRVDEQHDLRKFEARLPTMTVMGVRDVPVRGLDDARTKFLADNGLTVDLIYASAVPYGKYDNPRTSGVKRVADLTLLAQYTGSMRLAVARGGCDLFLMPLGGFAFGNDYANIRAAMASAYAIMGRELRSKNVRVYVLTYRGKPEEKAFFEV